MNAPFSFPALLPGEIVVDSFAGGGGTSEGIRLALGRDPDIAINHDALALAMHRVNHPGTHHMVEDVWHVDALGMCDGRPIGLLWLSPDCKHFSKAKGGKPREKAIRGLAWVGLRWVNSLPRRQRPRIIILENVEEFQDWGPLLDDGKPCPLQKGATFQGFIGGFRSLGYVAEWRELRACDYGDPTIRKRLFVILRRDKLPIVWPVRTHGNPKNEADAALIATGTLLPWRTAAEIIDFSLPCPSIFETSAEIKASLGLRAIRPLADNTMSRVAKGTMRYVVNSAKPFIIQLKKETGSAGGSNPSSGDVKSHSVLQQRTPQDTVSGCENDSPQGVFAAFVTKFNTGSVGSRMDEPLPTVTSHTSETHGGGAAPLGLVAPHLMTMRNAEKPFTGADEPTHTITAGGAGLAVVAPMLVNVANSKTTGREPNAWPADEPARSITSGGGQAIVAPILVGCGGRAGQSEPRPADEPVLTQTAKADACLVAPFLVPRYQEKPGHEPRTRSVDEPVATIINGDNVPGSLVTPFLVPRYGERPGQEPRTRAVDEPMPVIVPTSNEGSIAAVHLSRQFGNSIGADAEEPAPTVTAGGDGKTAVVAAFLAQHNTDRADGIKPGRPVEEPVSTITATGGQASVVAAYMAQHNTGETGHEIEHPVSTIVGKGCTQGLVAAHMLNLRGSDRRDAPADTPLQTVSAQGNHAALVAAFLAKYYGAGEPSQAADDPLHTVTAKPRHGLVTVTMQGEPYVITDIGMRMLTPRERFSAQGFRPNYIITYGLLEDGKRVDFTLEQQGRMCGNSVCPGMARALVAANAALRPAARRPRRQTLVPLLDAREIRVAAE